MRSWLKTFVIKYLSLIHNSLQYAMQTKLVDFSLLSAAEIDWLNDYHKQVWEKVR